MIGLADIFARGLAIVALVSWNTKLLADGRVSAILVAAVLSCVWWLNARSASKATGRGAMFAYSAGAGCGTAIGLWLGSL